MTTLSPSLIKNQALERFLQTPISKGSRPHKYALFYALVSLYEQNPQRPNRFVVADVQALFEQAFLFLTKGCMLPVPSIDNPFYYLQSEHFWFLQIRPGQEDEYRFIKDHKKSRFTVERLNSVFTHAFLAQEVDAALRHADVRQSIACFLSAKCHALYRGSTRLPDPFVAMRSKAATLSPSASTGTPMSFLSYLKTLQRQGGANQNALAEFQANDTYFAQIAVPHSAQAHIVQQLRDNKGIVVLTGHAGDGKTTLAFAVYRELVGLQPTQCLGNAASMNPLRFSFDGTQQALFVKDLSEQSRASYSALLQELLNPDVHRLLVSNTGALLEFLLDQTPDTQKRTVETELLEAMRSSTGSITFQGTTLFIHNLTLFNNLPMARSMFEKMLSDSLWPQCVHCPHGLCCPVAANRSLLKEKHVCDQLFLIYKRMQAYGVHLTMRQLTEHLAYTLSAGLDEQRLCQCPHLDSSLLDGHAHFYSLFFGDDKHDPAVQQMAAIRALREQEIGLNELPCLEKQLWHCDTTTHTTSLTLSPFAQALYQLFSKYSQGKDARDSRSRFLVRRLLYFCAQSTDTTLHERLQREFLRSYGLLLHEQLQQGQALSHVAQRQLLGKLFHVFQEYFTGIPLPTTSQNTTGNPKLYITLHSQEHNMRQSVQIILCALNWNDFTLREQKDQGGTVCLELVSKTHPSLKPLQLTVPFLDYVFLRHEGVLTLAQRSSFTQRLDAFKADLLRQTQANVNPQCLTALRYRTDFTLNEIEYVLNSKTLEVFYV